MRHLYITIIATFIIISTAPKIFAFTGYTGGMIITDTGSRMHSSQDAFERHIDIRFLAGFALWIGAEKDTSGYNSTELNWGYDISGQVIAALLPNLGVGIDFSYIDTTNDSFFWRLFL